MASSPISDMFPVPGSLFPIPERLHKAVFLLGTAYVVARHFKAWLRDGAVSTGSGPVEAANLRASPRVSMLIAAWNADEDLEALIESFRRLDYPDKEMILAVGGAHSLRDLEHLGGAGVRLIDHPGGLGKNRALARCLELAASEVLYLTDADCLFDSESFRRLIAPVVNGEEEVATGPSRPYAGQRGNRFVQHYWAGRACEFAQVGAYTEDVRGRNTALTRRALEAAGGFVPDVLGDDFYLGIVLRKAGYKIRFVPGSDVETLYHESVAGYVRQQSRWHRVGLLEQLRSGRHHVLPGWLLGSAVAVGTLALTLSLPFSGRRGAFYLAPLLLGDYLSEARRLDFARRGHLFRVNPGHFVSCLGFVYVNLAARARAFFDFCLTGRRHNW